MDLSQCIVLPGIVIDVNDPKHIGRVKAMVPTIFDSDYMNKEAMPWVYPFGMCGYQRFSKLENGRKIWVLHNKENDEEYWYWPMFEQTEETKEITQGYDATEVLLSRTGGEDGNIFIYYNNADGIVMKIGETKINITSNNEIHITDAQSSIKIVGGEISIGKEGDATQKSIMGESLKKALDKLASNLQKIGQAASGATPVSTISTLLMNAGEDLKQGCDESEILSDTVKITK